MKKMHGKSKLYARKNVNGIKAIRCMVYKRQQTGYRTISASPTVCSVYMWVKNPFREYDAYCLVFVHLLYALTISMQCNRVMPQWTIPTACIDRVY